MHCEEYTIYKYIFFDGLKAALLCIVMFVVRFLLWYRPELYSGKFSGMRNNSFYFWTFYSMKCLGNGVYYAGSMWPQLHFFQTTKSVCDMLQSVLCTVKSLSGVSNMHHSLTQSQQNIDPLLHNQHNILRSKMEFQITTLDCKEMTSKMQTVWRLISCTHNLRRI